MKKKVEHSLSIKARETRKEKRREHVVRTPRGKEESKSTAVSLFLIFTVSPSTSNHTKSEENTHTHKKAKTSQVAQFPIRPSLIIQSHSHIISILTPLVASLHFLSVVSSVVDIIFYLQIY
jgi:hypothetical protein